MEHNPNRSLKWFSGISGISVLVLGLGAFIPHIGVGKSAVAANPNGLGTVTVGVAKVSRENLSRELNLAAEFRPFQEIEIHAKVAGFVKQIFVDVGDRVVTGQPLAILEIPEFQDDLENAKAATKHAEEEIKRAQAQLQRSQSAHEVAHLAYTRIASVMKAKPNLIAQQEIDDAFGRDRVSEAQISTDEAALAAAKEQLQESIATEEKIKTVMAYSRITAPFSGVITKRYADTGAMIQAGTASNTQAMPLVRLSQNDLLRLILPVPESVVSRIRLDTPVEVKVQALGKSFTGKVARFSQRVDESTRTMETEVDVPNPDRVLMPGMFASTVLTLDQKNKALSLPVQAISGSTGNPTVLVVNPQSKIEERSVVLGIETPTKFEILSGLRESELVVVGNRSQLKTGQTVNPQIMDLSETKAEN